MINAVDRSRSNYQFASKDSQLSEDRDCISDELADFVSHCTLLSIVEIRMQHLTVCSQEMRVNTFHSPYDVEIGGKQSEDLRKSRVISISGCRVSSRVANKRSGESWLYRLPSNFRSFSFRVSCPGYIELCSTHFNSFGTSTICLVGSW
jgi:hypothetical protein